MKKLLIILGVFVCSITWAQQNLVPNGSFEELNNDTCPNATSNFNAYMQHWFQPSQGTSDVNNACATVLSGRNVPQAALGFQYAQDGVGYSGALIFAPSNPNYREYIAVGLLDTLKGGVNYCIKFYVALSEVYPKNISSVGVHFSPDSIYQNNGNPLQVSPQFENFNGNFINDTSAWTLIKGNYAAVGGEKYIYIGNFKNDANTIMDSSSLGSGTYVYIDNVQLYECDSLIGVEENKIKPIKIYPNPAQDFVSIDIPTNYKKAQLSIYNLTGQLVSTKQIQSNQTIPITDLGNGMYIFVVQAGDRVVGRQRVVVSR